MRTRLSTKIIGKILWYKEHYCGVSETARALGISRYCVGYWCSNWKRKPKYTYGPRNDDDNRNLRFEKSIVEAKILNGGFDEDNPVKAGRELRKVFKKVFGVYPETIN